MRSITFFGKSPLFVFAVGIVLIGAVGQPAALTTPMEVIRNGTDEAMALLRQARSGQGPSIAQRKEQILTIVNAYFNFEEMARRAVGRPWKDQPPHLKQEFTGLFKNLLFDTYLGHVDRFTGIDEKVVYLGEQVSGDHALVNTRVSGARASDIQIDYRLCLQDSKWKVYDVVVEGVSLVANYRSQFSAILANKDFPALLTSLRGKKA